jgi:uncharacterized membrane protein YqjE
MLHPALHLLASRPQWLAEHAGAYAQLAGAELGEAAALCRRQVLLGSLTLGAAVVAAILGGVALMLWAVTPTLPGQSLWWLVSTPAVPLAVALAGLQAQRRLRPLEAFGVLRQQWEADLSLLREASAR